MFNPYKLEIEYRKCQSYKEKFSFIKKQKWAYFQNHKEELKELLKTYESFDNEEDADRFQLENYTLRTFLLLDFLAREYKAEYKQTLTSTKPFDKDKFIIGLIRNGEEEFDLYDLVTKEFVDLSIYDNNRKKYIVEGLKRSNSFVCIAREDQLPLLDVIINDIKHKYKNINSDAVPTCSDINIDFLKAILFDHPKQTNNKDKIRKTLDKKIEEAHSRYMNNELTEEEFYVRYYYYMILKNNDVEKMYLHADEDMKPYILEAYYKLSSYSEMNDEFIYHERTESSLINTRILKTKYKKENE